MLEHSSLLYSGTYEDRTCVCVSPANNTQQCIIVTHDPLLDTSVVRIEFYLFEGLQSLISNIS